MSVKITPSQPNVEWCHTLCQSLYARLKNGRIMPWQCPSVRVFRNFLTCFEISVWNLVIHSVGGTTCRVWVSSHWHKLQLQVDKTHFLQSWPHKSRKILQIWYIGGPLYTSRHRSRFLSYFWNLGDYFRAFWIFRNFPFFFLHVSRCQLETWYILTVGGVTRQVRVSFQSGHFELPYSQK